jgi:tRNA (uracil-5-)-methyltransferase
VTSLHHLPYEDQLKEKIADLNKVIEHYNTQFFRDPETKRLMQEEQKDIQPLKLTEFIECPIDKKRTEYRSKSEFTIGKGENGDVVIGHNKGSYKNNTIMVESPKNVNIISKNTKLVVAVVENFIRTNFKDL